MKRCHRAILSLVQLLILILVALLGIRSTVLPTSGQLEDVTPPTLLSFEFTPTTIDVTGGPQVVTVTVKATDDLSGVLGAADSCFFSPSGLQQLCLLYNEVSRAGDPQVVTFQAVKTFPQFIEPGTWRIPSVSLTDNARNSRSFDLQALGFNTALQVISVQDTSPPTLVGLTINPTTVDVTAGAQTVTVRVQATDDVSGVLGAADSCFISPSGGQERCLLFNEISRTGSPEVVTFEAQKSILQFAESGTWRLHQVSLTDKASNTRFLSTGDIEALGFNARLNVISIQDVTPPTLVGFSISPTIIDTTRSSQAVTVTVQATDDVSGVLGAADSCFFSPSGGQVLCLLFNEVSRSGSPEVVTFEAVKIFPQFAELGTWHIDKVSLRDKAFNVRFFGRSEIEALEFNTLLVNRVSDSDTDGVPDDTDQCPSVPGRVEYNGCPVADKQTLFEHTIDRQNGGSSKMPVADAAVKVFDRNKLNGITLTTGEVLSKNPEKTLYPKIFDDAKTQEAIVGRCTTGQDGSCLAGEASVGDYLVLLRKVVQTGSETFQPVTVGLPKSPEDFIDGLATKEFQYIKVINKDGSVTLMSAQKAVITGSILEIIYPQFVVWDGTQFLYPFIFTSDSAWTVDVCASVPAGYVIVSDPCLQVFVSGETKTIFFDVVKNGSPEPMLNVRLTASHLGKTTNLELAIPGTATHQAIASPIPIPAILLTLLALLTVILTRPIRRLLDYLKSPPAFTRI